MFATMARTFKESIHMLAAGLGITVEDYDFVWDTAVAVRDVTVRPPYQGGQCGWHAPRMAHLEWRQAGEIVFALLADGRHDRTRLGI